MATYIEKKSLKEKGWNRNILKDLFLRQFNKVRGLCTLRLMNESTHSLLEHITFKQKISDKMNRQANLVLTNFLGRAIHVR
jgi:hypothetical protein